MVGAVNVSFFSDTGPGDWLNDDLTPPRLGFRTAVIQDTEVPGCDGMYFDEALWRGVADFAGQYDPAGQVTVLLDFTEYQHALAAPGRIASAWRRLTGSPVRARPPFPAALDGEVPLAEFLEGWLAEPAEDRSPPPVVLVRCSGELVLCVATEYWNRIGGRSATYHDTYTYSIFTDRPVGDALQRFLALHPEAHRWQPSRPPNPARYAPPPRPRRA